MTKPDQPVRRQPHIIAERVAVAAKCAQLKRELQRKATVKSVRA